MYRSSPRSWENAKEILRPYPVPSRTTATSRSHGAKTILLKCRSAHRVQRSVFGLNRDRVPRVLTNWKSKTKPTASRASMPYHTVSSRMWVRLPFKQELARCLHSTVLDKWPGKWTSTRLALQRPVFHGLKEIVDARPQHLMHTRSENMWYVHHFSSTSFR
jgi:hypothetical protein